MKCYPWQTTQWKLLSDITKITQPVLLTGPSGLGKSFFCSVFAQYVLCQDTNKQQRTSSCGKCTGCTWFLSESHPDYHLIKPHSGSISIEAVRNLQSILAYSPSQGTQYRVAIIQQAETLLLPASNALLKLLEELSQHTVLVLSTDSLQKLPKTLISRCLKVSFRPSYSTATQDWLKTKKNNVSLEAVSAALRYSYGAPLLALHYLETEKVQLLQTLITHWISLKQGLLSPIEITQHYLDIPIEHLLGLLTGYLIDIAYLQQCPTATPLLSQTEIYKKGIALLSQSYSLYAIEKLFAQISAAQYLSKKHPTLNTQLLLENLFIYAYQYFSTTGTTAYVH